MQSAGQVAGTGGAAGTRPKSTSGDYHSATQTARLRTPPQPLPLPFLACTAGMGLQVGQGRKSPVSLQSTFSKPFKQKCVSEEVRIGSMIIFHQIKL